ncbi:LCP family protein [Thermopolyspora sp. NPDC052614]|uniref:LCP family protein n=1 Tax=Thermopolyspora sp. NPDC052614 TaxID=3155682 RepID=UPI003437AD75
MDADAPAHRERRGLPSALALTVASALLWGVAHLFAGRSRVGVALLASQTALFGAVLAGVTALRFRLVSLAVQPGWLTGLILALALVGAVWAAVVVLSYRAVRPPGTGGAGRVAARLVVGALCVLVIAPFAYAARVAYVSRDVLTTLFAAGGDEQAEDPWRGRSRVSILLVGADAARNRPGARTDSMTVATIDTRDGRTVLFGLPRNLERVPMPDGPARRWFPYGFTGDGTARTPGLLNEVYQWAEDHPAIVPGVPDGRRGPTLLKQTVSGILGIPVDYYAVIDMKGFQNLIDAIGGVVITVKSDIPYGRQGHVLPAGTRRLSGKEALWYGRSRSDSSDYVRMARQKCLLHAVARQADPALVLSGFERIADAAKRYVSTDIPRSVLPALVDLAVKAGDSSMTSLQFVPPLIDTAAPDWHLIRRKVSDVLSPARPRHSPRAPATPAPSPAPDAPVSLDTFCV